MSRRRFVKWGGILVLILIVGFLVSQLVPYGRNHSNPPVVREPEWDSAQTRALAQRACFDCHSNESVWPWYSNIAPVSWLVQRDVMEGRAEVNFSDWKIQETKKDRNEFVEEFVEVVLEGEMPPRTYLITHPEAMLTQSEKQQLADGLKATLLQTLAQAGQP